MQIKEELLQTGERVSLALRALYYEAGYRPYRMSKFEEYDLYAQNKEFLLSENVITFTDTNGRLMALKPDVTLSIIKNSPDTPEALQKVCYNENVYRISKGTGAFKEIMQSGLEAFGKVGDREVAEVLLLAARSLRLLSPACQLAFSNLSLVEQALSSLGIPPEKQGAFYPAIGDRNPAELAELCSRRGLPEDSAEKLRRLVTLRVPAKDAAAACREILQQFPGIPEDVIKPEVLQLLAESEEAENIFLDLSVVDDASYYNGIVFKGFLSGIPTAVISGGQYDKLMAKLHRRSSAIGFAVYTDTLEQAPAPVAIDPSAEEESRWLNIALPKGRLGEKVYRIFAEAGFDCPELLEQNRKLLFENPEKKVRYFWVKPSDVAIYVERGAADLGVAGKDILLEWAPDLYELADMGVGICRMAVAAPAGFADRPDRTLKVATKFANIAREYYQSKGRDIDIIPLNGSIEIAPLLGLSDVIVDIVETGATLRENHLEVIEEVLPISARLVANKASYKFKTAAVEALLCRLQEKE